jgi:hypothetical protein
MKRNILSTLGLTAVFAVSIFTISSIADSGTTSAYANTGGSPGGKTNSPTDGSSCTQCHSGTINSGSAFTSISSNVAVSGYVPGQTYTITGSIEQGAINKFGFEITAEDNSGSKVGTSILTDATRTKFVNSNNGVSHTTSGTTPSSLNTSVWSFDWTAPSVGTGDVTFYGAFNAVNSNSSTSGDQVYTKTLTISEDISTGLAENVNDASFNIYPNPVVSSFQITSNTSVDRVTVFNVQGQQMTDLTQVENKVNMENLASGIYVVNIETNGQVISKKIIKE